MKNLITPSDVIAPGFPYKRTKWFIDILILLSYLAHKDTHLYVNQTSKLKLLYGQLLSCKVSNFYTSKILSYNIEPGPNDVIRPL